jgi:hypothetical protein
MKSEERAALLDSLIFFDLHINNRTLAKVLEQLDDITPTLSTLKADHLLSHLITASYFVTCTRMSYRGSDSPNIVHPQPQGGRKKKHRETIELRTTKGSGPCHGCGPARLIFQCQHLHDQMVQNLRDSVVSFQVSLMSVTQPHSTVYSRVVGYHLQLCGRR